MDFILNDKDLIVIVNWLSKKITTIVCHIDDNIMYLFNTDTSKTCRYLINGSTSSCFKNYVKEEKLYSVEDDISIEIIKQQY